MYIWDIDGTLLMNKYQTPDWDDPLAIHPQTGEPVTGQMPIYNEGNYLNPDLEGVNLVIDTVLTARPEYRRSATLEQLKKFTNNTPNTIIMYPSHRRYTHKAALAYKINHLDFIAHTTAPTTNENIYYIDEDETTRALINIRGLYGLYKTTQPSRIEAISIDQYFDMEAGK